MSGAVTDIRDVLGIEGASEPRQPPVKKLKTDKRPDGITRELYALLGENAPPVAVIEQRFKEKPRFYGKVTPWERTEFTNSARGDNLRLRHWVRQSPNSNRQSDGDETMNTDEPLDSHFAKFNIQVDVLRYNDKEYSELLKDADWSREETDYLFELLRDYDLRWPIVADRYEWGVTPEPEPEPEPEPKTTTDSTTAPATASDPIVKEEKEDGMEGVELEKPAEAPSKEANGGTREKQPAEPEPPKKPQRTMEDLKERYYSVCRSVLESRTPIGRMTPAQLEYFNSLKFNKAQETERKRILKIQLSRTTEDLEKEKNLIHELRRITDNHQHMLEEREDLFNRLDFPSTTGSIAAYQNSQGLAALAQSLLASDRSKKRKSIAAGAPGAAAAAAAGEAGSAQSPTVPSHKDKEKDKDKDKDKDKEKDAETTTEKAAAATTTTTTKAETKHQRNQSISNKGGDKDEAEPKSSTKDKKKEKEKDKEPVVRTLTAAEEKTFGVTHHDKLQSGVWVRSQKMTLPKGHGYNPKYINLMTELSIPPALTMPTGKNCQKYEALCAEVGVLWDLRKAVEKVEHEIKVFEKQEALAKADEGSGAPKRSASVMSDTSKASKKPKKDK